MKLSPKQAQAAAGRKEPGGQVDTSYSGANLTTADLLDVDGLMDKTRDLYEYEAKDVQLGVVRLSNLVLMRESSANDWIEAEGLISQAASLYPDIDGIDLIAKLGVEPLRSGKSELRIVVGLDEDTGEELVEWVHVDPLEVGKAKGVLFEFRGTAYLYSMSSAAQVDEVGHQDWTRMLIRELRRWQPIAVRAVSVSRYTRNLEVAGLLLHAFSRNCDEVWAGAMQLQMKGIRSATDKLLFTMLAMAAALERDASVSRMGAGKVFAAQKNFWLPGLGSVPPGWVLQDRTLVANPTPEERAKVRTILEAIADDLGPTEFSRALGRAGVKLRPERGIRNGGVDGAVVTSEDLLQGRSVEHGQGKSQRKKRYLSLVPLWVCGIHISKMPNPFPGATHIGSLPVTVEANGREVVHVISTFDLPPGGWADQELLNAAMVVATRHSERADVKVSDEVLATLPPAAAAAYVAIATDSELRKGVKPAKAPMSTLWAGTSWSDPDFDWHTAGRGVGSLKLVRTPKVDSAPTVGGDIEGSDGDGS